ncbi:sucrase ferredoxin [Nakamurella antarctica]|uniref:Sucrase ferredoxin n=1 Tax=Nakamurella antarctica TaxID=1902245 RepID=A0A3G8ZVV3_9ACTN|nr:sucrase ferredoxin [Nakamurella antarctica]AZI58146.1 sucrase ferredoxin [Nakamurella antarctica]
MIECSRTESAPDLLCSRADLEAGDDLRGTSSRFASFVLIDHRRNWSSNVAEESASIVFGQDAATLSTLTDDGLRPFAIRPLGRSADQDPYAQFVGRIGHDGLLVELPAGSVPTAESIVAATLAPAVPSAPLFAVCTNGKRDRCCAIQGRPVAERLAQELPSSKIFEISHIGGHRFAPTMLVLPSGYSYGRLTEELALEVAHAAISGLVHPGGLRGRADLSPAAQTADIIWRTEIGPAPLDDVIINEEVISSDDKNSCVVSAQVRGRARHIRLTRSHGPQIQETLCGGKPFTAAQWQMAAL